MGTGGSGPFRVQVAASASDGAAWINNYNTQAWEDGDTPGGAFTTLAAIAATIPSTGGWAQIPNTACQSVLQHQRSPGWPIGIRDSAANWTVWGSGAFTGKSWLIGAVGGHSTYNGNEMYRIRLTDPPAAVRLYNTGPASRFGKVKVVNARTGERRWFTRDEWLALGEQPGDMSPDWGPYASHQYDAMRWDPSSKLLFLGGLNNANEHKGETYFLPENVHFGAFYTFDLSKPTPKSAWRSYRYRDFIPTHGGSGYPSTFLESPTALALYQRVPGTGINNALLFNPQTGAVTSGGSSFFPKDSRPDNGDPWMVRRRTPTRAVGVSGWNQFNGGGNHVVASNPGGGTVTFRATIPLSVWNPTYVNGSDPGSVRPGMAVIGEKCVVWATRRDAFLYDATTGATDLFTTARIGPDPSPGWEGTYGKWAAIPQINCFVGIPNTPTQNLWLFRPPRSWGIGS